MRLASCGVKWLNSSSVFQINFSVGWQFGASKSRTNAKRKNVVRHFTLETDNCEAFKVCHSFDSRCSRIAIVLSVAANSAKQNETDDQQNRYLFKKL